MNNRISIKIDVPPEAIARKNSFYNTTVDFELLLLYTMRIRYGSSRHEGTRNVFFKYNYFESSDNCHLRFHLLSQALLLVYRPGLEFLSGGSKLRYHSSHPTEGVSSPTLWLWSPCGKDARVSERMVSTARTSFMDEEADPGPESRYSGSWSCGTSEGSRIWCNRTDTMGIIMAAMAL